MEENIICPKCGVDTEIYEYGIPDTFNYNYNCYVATVHSKCPICKQNYKHYELWDYRCIMPDSIEITGKD